MNVRTPYLAVVGVLSVVSCGSTARSTSSGEVRAPAPPPIATSVSELAGGLVESVEVEGLRTIAVERARESISTKEGEALDLDRVSRDVRAIWALGGINDVSVHGRFAAEGRVVVRFAISELPSVRAVKLEGDPGEPDKLRELLSTRSGASADPSLIRRDVAVLLKHYGNRGYLAAEVNARTDDVAEGEQDVIFKVIEGGAFRVDSIVFTGNSHIETAELQSLIADGATNQRGGTFSPAALESGLARVQEAYYDRGFIDVRVGRAETNVNADSRVVAVLIPIDERDRYRFGNISFKGPLAAPERRYTAKLLIKRGAVFNRSLVKRTLEQLTSFHRAQSKSQAKIEAAPEVDQKKHVVHLTFEIRGEQSGD